MLQDLISWNTINTAVQNGVLYYFEDGPENKHQFGPISSFFESFFKNNKDGVVLVNLILGHPSFKCFKCLEEKYFS